MRTRREVTDEQQSPNDDEGRLPSSVVVERPERIAPLEQVLHARKRETRLPQLNEIRLKEGTVLHVRCWRERVQQ